jgi:hypothetical protein
MVFFMPFESQYSVMISLFWNERQQNHPGERQEIQEENKSWTNIIIMIGEEWIVELLDTQKCRHC